MPCLVNTKTGSIHDASKKHTEKFSKTHFEIVDTLPEAKAKVKKLSRCRKRVKDVDLIKL